MEALLYFDYAAATPVDPRVYAAMQPYFSERFYNPSATYGPAQVVRAELEAARAGIAHWLGARPNEIVFTAGGTEANNLAVRGIMEQFPDGNVIVSNLEHESVLQTARHYSCREMPATPDGIVDIAALAQLIDDATVLVSIMYANNEIGTIQPIRKLSRAIAAVREDRRLRGIKRPIYLHTDAAQAAAYLDLHVSRLGVDLLSINSGKIYGPKGSGALFVASGVQLRPQVWGGGQERGLRSGTENVAGAVGLATALELVQRDRHAESARLALLQNYFFDLLTRDIPTAIINGSRKFRLPNNVHVTFPGQDNERLLFALAEKGILCAAGSACSASSDEPSHVLDALGLSASAARASLRFTFGHDTTREAVEQVVAALAQLVRSA